MDLTQLKSLSRRQLEEMQAAIAKELISCAICGREGAGPYVIRTGGKNSRARASIKLCLPCFEHFREPESLALTETN